MSDHFQRIRNQVMWDRLIAVVEEQARTMMRVAFSTVVREAGDLSAGIFNAAGQLLAQAVTGTPGHINSMARSVKHFLNEIPADTMRPGDVFITNDPWKGTGHLFDLTVVSPTFHGGRLVALFACTAHVADIGGNGPDPASRDVFAEGLFIPIMPLCMAGEMNACLMSMLRANSREPDQLEGDVYALVASNEAGAGRLRRMMEEYRLSDLDALSEHILQTSDRSMREAINKLPRGSWTNSMRIDGYDVPLDLVATMTIEEDVIRIDYAGTSDVSRFGINCPLCYTDAYTSFGVKCIVAPRLANNAAALSRIRVTAPDNCVTNALFPSPVTARAMIGQMLPISSSAASSRPCPARCRPRVPARAGACGWEPAPASPEANTAHPPHSCRRIFKAAAWGLARDWTDWPRRRFRPASRPSPSRLRKRSPRWSSGEKSYAGIPAAPGAAGAALARSWKSAAAKMLPSLFLPVFRELNIRPVEPAAG